MRNFRDISYWEIDRSIFFLFPESPNRHSLSIHCRSHGDFDGNNAGGRKGCIPEYFTVSLFVEIKIT